MQLSPVRKYLRAALVAAVAVLGLQAGAARALVSQFLGSDPYAAQVVAGTPYDMNVAGWRRPNADIDRGTFAYKLYSAFLMLGYQTEMGSTWGLDDSHLRCLHLFQQKASLPVSNLVDAATIAALDAQLAAREAVLAPLAPTFPLYAHMQPLPANEVSRDTVGAIYGLAHTILPPALRPGTFELIQCFSFQCVGEIQDSAGTGLYAHYGFGTWIDPASDYRFVGAYFDALNETARRPSAAVDLATALHEYAHYVDGSFGQAYAPSSFPAFVPLWRSLDTTGFYAIGYDLSTDANGCFTRRSESAFDWISKYAFTPGYGGCAAGKYVAAEDFAESFAFYITAGRNFRDAISRSPMLRARYDWLRQHVHGGVEFDTDLPGDWSSGCNDIHGSDAQLPGYIKCDDSYTWDFTLPHGVVAGSCGPAQSAAQWTTPTSGLCTRGYPSLVTGTTTWSWTCEGLNGGAPASCAAGTSVLPDSPTGVSAAAGDAQASVSFTPPSNSGASAIQYYSVTSSPGGLIATGSGSPIVVAGLTNGALYSFTVTATNGHGTSGPSAASAAVRPSGLPSAAAIGTATPGVNSASVTFGPPASNGGLAITGYTVTSSPGGFTASGTTSPLVVLGLATGVPYTFTVRAINSNGPGPASAPSNSATPVATLLPLETFEASAIPSLPTGWQSLLGIHADGAWRANAGTRFPAGAPAHGGAAVAYFNGHDAAAGSSARLVSPPFSLAGVTGAKLAFWIYRDANDVKSDRVDVYVGTGTTVSGATLLASINRFRGFPPATPDVGWQKFVYDIPGGFNGTTNYVLFDGAAAGGGSDIHLDDIVVATVPGAPAVTGATPGSGQVTLTFTPPGSDGGSAIESYVATCTGGGTFTATGAGSPITVTGLANGTSYACTVSATNAVGTSLASSGANATSTMAPAITSGPVAAFTVNAPGTFTVTATGLPAPTLSLAGTLPDGVTFDSASGVLSGTPASGTAGTWPLTVTASNGTAPDTTAPLTITVERATQTLAFGEMTSPSIGRTTYVAAYSSAPLPVTVVSNTASVCAVPDSWQLTAVSTGTCTLVASQPGNADYLPATPVAISFEIGTGAPLAPSSPSAIPGDGALLLAFAAPASDGGQPVTGYSAMCNPGAITVAGNASPIAVPGLANGTTYACTLAAINASGTGDETPHVLATPGGAPGRLALVPDAGTGYVSAIDVTTQRVVATISAGTEPTALAFEPSGRRAWVTDRQDGAVRAIDVTTWSVSAPIAVGQSPYGIAIHPQGNLAVVTLQGEAKVAFIDLSTQAVTRLAVGTTPTGVSFDPAGARAFVTNANDSTLSVIDVATRAVTHTVPVGSGPFGVAVHPAGTFAYTVSFNDGSLSAIDLATRAVTTVPLGTDATSVAVDAGGTRILVTSMSDGKLVVLDAATLAVQREVPGIGAPLALDANGTTAYVVDAGGPALVLVDLATGNITGNVALQEPRANPGGLGRFLQPAAAAPPAPADLSVAQSRLPLAVSVGRDVAWSITVTNAGPNAAAGATLSDTLPAGATFVWATPGCVHSSGTVTCSLGSIAPGASARVLVAARPSAPGAFDNTVAASSAMTEANPGDNASTFPLAVPATPAGVPVLRYRLYSPVTLEHHFTTDLNEYNVLGSQVGTWNQEGNVGKLLDNPGSFGGVAAVPYYRLYDTGTRWHHWTSDSNEYYTLIGRAGWNGEGIDGFILPTSAPGTTQLFRLTYPAIPGLHHWTIDPVEYSALIANFGWVGEGGSGYVIP